MNEDMKIELDFLKSSLQEDNPALAGEGLVGAAFTLFKKRYKKQSSGWMTRDTVAAEMPIAAFYNLNKSGPPEDDKKPESIKDTFLADPDKFFIEASAVIVPDADSSILELEHAKLDNKSPEDFIIMKSVLVTSLPYVNANGDAFTAEDLKDAVGDGQMSTNCPAIVDWLHDFSPYGTTIKAEIQENTVAVETGGKIKNEKVTQIVVWSVFWAWLYPEKAAAVRQWHREDKLRFSMACGAKKKQYIEEEGRYYRLLGKPTFYANSIIAGKSKPADANAVPIDIAGWDNVETKSFMPGINVAEDINKSQNKHGDNDMTLEQALALIEKLEEQNKDLAARIEGFEKSDAEKSIAVLTQEKEDLQASLKDATATIEDFTSKNGELEEALSDSSEKNTEMVEQLKTYREKEVARLNEKVEAVFNAVPGLADEQKAHWVEKYKAELSDEGIVKFDQEGFDADVAAMPKVEEKSEPGKMVKASKDAGTVTTKNKKAGPEDKSPMV